MSTKKEIIFNGIWDELSDEDRNKVCVKHLKSVSAWDLKRILCCVFDVDYMDDEMLRQRFNDLVWTR